MVLFILHCLLICYFIHISLRIFMLSFMIFQALSGATGLSTKWAEMCEGSRKVFWLDMISNICFPLVFKSKTNSTRPTTIYLYPNKLIQILESLWYTCKMRDKNNKCEGTFYFYLWNWFLWSSNAFLVFKIFPQIRQL